MPATLLKPPAILEIQPDQISLNISQKSFQYSSQLEIEILVQNIIRDFESESRYLSIQIHPAMLIELAPITAQTQHQLMWKIAENLPCPMETIAFCSEALPENIFHVSYLKKELIQNLISALEDHDCQIDAVTVAYKKLEQIEFKKPWFAWHDIQKHQDRIYKGLSVLAITSMILFGSSFILNQLEDQYWNLKQELTTLEKLKNMPEQANPEIKQKRLVQILDALASLPGQTKTNQIRFSPENIQLQGESFKNHSLPLKTWLNQLGGQIVRQESGASLNAKVEFTAQINL